MKRTIALLWLVCLLLSGCARQQAPAMVAATTLPVYQFTQILCSGTEVTVTRLVTENVSCLHEYSLSVSQAQALEQAQLVVISGGGLEDFLGDLLGEKEVLDSGEGIALLECEEGHHDHAHEADAHTWLSPENAAVMAKNICRGLTEAYPQHRQTLEKNLKTLLEKIREVADYGNRQLQNLSSRKLITFHDGFRYFARAFDLEILKAVEEESGSEASARELKELVLLAREHGICELFTEKNGSTSAAETVCREIVGEIYILDMAMAGESWFDAMYHNIDTVKEALE